MGSGRMGRWGRGGGGIGVGGLGGGMGGGLGGGVVWCRRRDCSPIRWSVPQIDADLSVVIVPGLRRGFNKLDGGGIEGTETMPSAQRVRQTPVE